MLPGYMAQVAPDQEERHGTNKGETGEALSQPVVQLAVLLLLSLAGGMFMLAGWMARYGRGP